MPDRSGGWLTSGIDLLRDSGRLAGTGVVEVDGMRHTADHVVVACGADPVIPPVAGLRELDRIWTNREATGMNSVPRRLLVRGGGPVGVEMGRPSGASAGRSCWWKGRATCLRVSPRRWTMRFHEVLRRDGIKLVLGARVTAARRDGDDYVLELGDGRELRGDRLLVATGRRPRVDAHMRAGERLWAIGDVTGIWPLTHVGKYQGRVVAANILGEPREAHYEAVPRVTYTDPQAAAVGATEARFSATASLSEVARPPPIRTPTPSRTASSRCSATATG